MFHDLYYTQFTNLSNNLIESWDLYIAPFDWHLRSGDSVPRAVFDVNPVSRGRLFETFEISPGVFLPPGEYRFTRSPHQRDERRPAQDFGQLQHRCSGSLLVGGGQSR